MQNPHSWISNPHTHTHAHAAPKHTGSHSLRSNSSSHGANHPQQMFRNVQLDLWQSSEEQPSQPLVLFFFFLLCPTRTRDCTARGCQHNHSLPLKIPPLSEIHHPRRQRLNRSQSLGTLGRGLPIYPNNTVWTVTWLMQQCFNNVSLRYNDVFLNIYQCHCWCCKLRPGPKTNVLGWRFI